ncbi:Glycosyl transferase, group 1 family, partial [Candidatus Magnetomorum sp. HK-1]
PYFHGFVEQIKDSDTLLNVTTNGTFPIKGAEAWARELLPITSDTKISINSIAKSINESIMVNANTDRSLKNIKTYLKVRDEIRAKNTEHRPTVTLQVTYMYKNLHSIIDIIKFAIENNVDRVKGHHLWVTYPELKKENLRNIEYHDMWNGFVDKIEKYRQHIVLENFEKLIEKPEIVFEDYSCPFIGKELWIDSYGN